MERMLKGEGGGVVGFCWGGAGGFGIFSNIYGLVGDVWFCSLEREREGGIVFGSIFSGEVGVVLIIERHGDVCGITVVCFLLRGVS